jgi:hypothetical protein
VHADERVRQGLHLLRVKRSQVIGATRQTQGHKISQGNERKNAAFGEPPERRK